MQYCVFFQVVDGWSPGHLVADFLVAQYFGSGDIWSLGHLVASVN